VNACTAERVDAHPQPCAADDVDVDDARQIVDIARHEVVLVRRRCAPRTF